MGSNTLLYYTVLSLGDPLVYLFAGLNGCLYFIYIYTMIGQVEIQPIRPLPAMGHGQGRPIPKLVELAATTSATGRSG